MTEDSQKDAGPGFLLGAWMKATQDFWGSLTEVWQSVFEASQPSSKSQESGGSRPQEVWFSTVRSYQAMLFALGEPEGMEAVSQGIKELPQVVLKMAQTGWEGYFRLQQQWLEKAGKIGDRATAPKFESLDRDVFRSWLEIYHKDFRQFLNIPQLGLTRVYQERLHRAVDKFNLFQLVGSEFLYLLYLPVEKSLQVMGERLQKLSEEGNLSEDFKEHYNTWIKILEGQYMTLYKTPEYTQTLSKALNAMEDFIVARQELLTDTLKTLPVPTNEDMDELYKELYLLKKRLREIEKKMDKR